ncbi:TIGR02680 family protein [Mesobacillus jeotgali]|uniref:TIGR02680 family protein n=1 Tax=Mesobacillus jeotgali TaxID=129985 RepID=A0ABY9VMK2_9BACI|nr:TIGR02680 family protein [Mesobacillus jeotgali]WNF24870.1 TIGR02680 family protein [Mesobacillus jeotgali]
MLNTRWMMNRAGLLNFWYYDEEIFHFEQGKLLLRGSNGSGKSVTMQSFLPVLLDGKKSPDRLDPFGSKARRMEDYLLGEKEVVNRDERTGYLFIEYKKQGSEQYITTGIGMQAKRNKSIKSWYFLLTDNRRIGHDFHLVQKHTGEKIPLSAKELENRIGQGGYVVHTQREYLELVNKYVFGFQSIDAYEDLIKLLIQLRSPKLSKDFKPTVIYEILESALPPLTDDELRHLSDTIESMDQTQQQLEQLNRESESINRLETAYDTYNKYILAERADQWQKALLKSKAAEGKVEEYTSQQQLLDQEITKLRVDLSTYQQQKHVAEQESSSLRQHEVWSLERKRTEKVEESAAVLNEIASLKRRWDDNHKKLRDEYQKKQAAEDELFQYSEKERELLGELALDADSSAFHQHEVNASDYDRGKAHGFDFTVWQKEAKDHRALLGELEKLAMEAVRLGEDQSRLQRQSSEKKKEIDGLQKDLDHYQGWFEEEHQKLESNVFLWMENHPKLVYSNEHRQGIARALQGLYERNRYDDVRSQLYHALHAYEGEVRKDEALTKDRIKQKQNEIREAEAELLRIKTQKMLDPERSAGTENHRTKLKGEGVSFLPFYAAVEFQDHVTDKQRERLESALKRIGILDSLIMDRSASPVEDALLSADPRLLGYTLADYLMPDLDEDSPLSEDLVDQVLRSIPLENDGTGFHIDHDGTYSIGCLRGHAPIEATSKFIGRSSRKRHQRELIQLWTEKLQGLSADLSDLKHELQQFITELESIDTWKIDMPDDKILLDIYDQIVKKQHQLENERALLSTIDEDWKLVYDKYTNVKRILRDKGVQLNIPLTVEDLGSAVTSAQSYIDFLHELKNNDVKVSSAKTHLQTYLQRIDELEEGLDELKGEQSRKESHLGTVKATIESIDQQLQLKGIDEVRNRIREVQRLLQEAESEIDRIKSGLPKAETDQERVKEKLEEAKMDLSFWKRMGEEWSSMVEAERKRGFFTIEGTGAHEILDQYEPVLLKHERSKLSEQLTKVFFNEHAHLTEYRMFEYTEDAEIPAWFADGSDEKYEPFLSEWHQLKGRRLIQMEYRGQRVSPYYVSTELKKELDEQQGWLDEQDRWLYEDIILNSVGIILRNRIQRAQQWVKEMDKIMADRDNSSGLIFSIAWKPLTAESEKEMDTKDLVQLLQRNSKFLNEEDLQKITKHFQSRIAKAKELIQLRNEGSTLHQVLKEVLDYRKWFTFVLSFSRVNEPKRELTNNAFFKFSGGEKAMAMYIPLFTAAYSRYKEAGDMAPYIISLDEAFAGVDENNIRDMFEVVEQLGFNYIMNSQALWGDYDTISSLAICELVRPKNADFVTVIRYQWDGKQKSLVFEEAPEELVTNE